MSTELASALALIGYPAGGTTIAPIWRGARLQLVSATSVANNTFAAFASWPTPLADTNNFWASGSPSRFTIPAGVTKVRLVGKTFWANSSTGQRWCFVRKNGADLVEGGGMITQAAFESTTTITSGTVSVVAGDYFELLVAQNTGGALNLTTPSYFEIEVIEGSVLNQTVVGTSVTTVPVKSVPATGALTLVGNTSGASLTAVTNGLKLTQTSPAANTQACHVAAVKTIAAPAAAWSVTFDVVDHVQRMNFASGTFVMVESATNKTLVLTALRGNVYLSGTRQGHMLETNLQLFTAQTAGVQSGSYSLVHFNTVPWRRVRFSYDLTNLKIDVSWDDGDNWINAVSQAPTAYGFTTRPDQVGFGVWPWYEDATARLCTSICKDFTLTP